MRRHAAAAPPPPRRQRSSAAPASLGASPLPHPRCSPLLRRGACECVCRRWRRACQALPSRVSVDIEQLKREGQSLAAALTSGRNVAEVNLLFYGDATVGPLQAWQEVADVLPTTVERRVRG